MPDHASERWNFAILLGHGVSRRIGNELSSEKLVLPFLYTAFGGPIFFVGFFPPLVIIAGIAAQLLGARLIEVTHRGRFYLAGTAAVAASALLLTVSFGHAVPVFWLAALFLGATSLWGMGNGLGVLTFEHMIGQVLSERLRINLLFSIAAAGGVGVIIVTVVSQMITGLTPEQDPADNHLHLVISGAAMLLLSSVIAMAMREELPPRAMAGDAVGRRSYFTALLASVRRVSRLPWFRRFVIARVLLLSVEVTMPFFAFHAATFHARTAPSLTILVISVSLGMIGGGLVWPRVSKRSVQLVLSASAIVAGAAALIGIANHLFHDLQSLFFHATMIFLLGFATQGAVEGSIAYVVGSSTEEQRPYCIAVASLAAGLTGFVMAFMVGLIAEERGAVAALLIMGVLNVAAAVYVRTLPVVRPTLEAGQPATSPPPDGSSGWRYRLRSSPASWAVTSRSSTESADHDEELGA